MSTWRKIITSGSHAELRRVSTGPLRVSDTTYKYVNGPIPIGSNFIPNLTFQYSGTPSFNDGAMYYGNANGIASTTISPATFNQDDVDNMTDGDATSTDFADMAVIVAAGSEASTPQYLYISFPFDINVDSWKVIYGFTDYVPNTPGQWQFSVLNPSGFAGTVGFENLWTDWNDVQTTNGFEYTVSNSSTTSYRYWRFKHTFDSAASTPSTAVNLIRDIQANRLRCFYARY